MTQQRKIIVPVSGGKDSQAVLSLALSACRSRDQVVCVHQNTGYDHPLTYKHLKEMERFYGVQIEHTKHAYGDMFGFLEYAKYFPNSAARGCTKELKQRPFLAWLQEKGFNKNNCEIWFGMRAEESKERDTKYGGIGAEDQFTLMDVSDFYGSNKRLRETVGPIPVRLPIVDWTVAEVFDHLSRAGAPVNELYAKGNSRVGCYPCLLARKEEWAAAARDPYGRENIQKLIAQEDEWKANGNPRKLIRVHKVWYVRDFLKGADVEDLPPGECGWCSI